MRKPDICALLLTNGVLEGHERGFRTDGRQSVNYYHSGAGFEYIVIRSIIGGKAKDMPISSMANPLHCRYRVPHQPHGYRFRLSNGQSSVEESAEVN